MDIFINKKKWSEFSKKQMQIFEKNVFNHYKKEGFPYFDLSKDEKLKILNKLKNFNSSDILKDGNVLSQNMLGLNLINSYMPHMWETRSGNFFTPLEIFKNDSKFKKAIKKRINLGDNMSDAGIRKICSMYSGTHKVSNFRPTIAKYIYDNYSGQGQVLDFSSGYGGRLIGALMSDKVEKYFGYDPCTKTFEAYKNILQDMIDFNIIKKVAIENEPFENSILPFEFFDLAFSSPPYFNTEVYSDEMTQSCNKYPIKQLWKFKFLKVLIDKCYNALKPNGHFIINIANVKNYIDLEKDTMEFALDRGFKHIKTYQMTLSALMKKGFKYEPIFVFQK